MKGVYGRIRHIDLTDQTTTTESIPEELYRKYLGGKGLATHLLTALLDPGVDPLSADNKLIIGLGPAVNTRVWGSSRYGVFTLSPQTGFLAHSYSGGRVAEQMGSAGCDAYVLHGAASSPVHLVIDENGVSFEDAGELWGQEIYTTLDAVKARVSAKAGSIAIGPAGENLVRIAMVGNDYWRCAGRCGVGAVLGSKKVKAISFHGSAKKEAAKSDVLQAYWDEIRGLGQDHPVIKAFKTYGTPGLVGTINQVGAFPTRYWSKGSVDDWENISAEALHAQCQVTPRACAKCLMACGRLTTVKAGRHKGLTCEGPEYETIYALGGLCEITDIAEILFLNDLCDRLGLDTMSGGNLVAFAIEAVRLGRLNGPWEYGDPDGVAALLKDIAYKRGAGAVLAEGIRYAAEKWNMQDKAVHVKGMEPAAYDPRYFKGMGLAYATSDRGACHLRSTVFKASLAGNIAHDAIQGHAEQLIDYEDRLNLADGLIVCRFYRDILAWDGLARIIEGTLGMTLDRDGLKAVAANIRNASQRFNRKMGLTKADDSLPPRFYKERLDNKYTITREELETMRADYYRLRGWDADGVPPDDPT
jgi:aldehyde:ferredoxin oxidoreductase